MTKLNIGLIGAGFFAGYHASKAASSDYAVLNGVYDLDINAAEKLVEKIGQGEATTDLDILIMSSDAVMIATPAVTHASLVGRALRAGRHVLVEKPLALTGIEANALVELAQAKEMVLQVGHQERFVFEAMGVLGAPEKPVFIEAVREAPPSPTGRCEDVSVVFDLMVHDIDLANAAFGGAGRVSGATGATAHTDKLDEVTARIAFDDGAEAVIKASRCASERKRTMKAVFPSGEIEIDFIAKTVRNETDFDIRLDVSDIMPDPLKTADEAFFMAALGHSPSPIPGHLGARAVAMAEAVEKAAYRHNQE